MDGISSEEEGTEAEENSITDASVETNTEMDRSDANVSVLLKTNIGSVRVDSFSSEDGFWKHLGV